MNRPVFAANWKMHKGPLEATRFFEAFLERVPSPAPGRLLFFPPALSLAAAARAIHDRDDVGLGVQNIHWEATGAFTGEVSAPMAAQSGATAALVGHSERRHIFGETIQDTVRKAEAALEAGLTTVLCVGETLEEREAGRAESVVESQLRPVLERPIARQSVNRLMVAYEPVWAIGTGRTASPDDARAMHESIGSVLSAALGDAHPPILYGGSVKPDNALALLTTDRVDGVLVGGASLDPETFAAICTVF